MSNKDGTDERIVSRRAVAAVFGSLGAVVGARVLTGCAPSARGFEEGGKADVFQEALSLSGLEYVATIADLRAFASATTPPTTDAMFVLGYWARGDGGGGFFWWDSASTAADDKGTVIQPDWAVGAGRWRRFVDDHVDVRWFGARGDSIASPTRELEAFHLTIRCLDQSITSGEASLGPTVTVPPGTYRFDGTLSIDRLVVLRGAAGAGSSGSAILEFPVGHGVEVFRSDTTSFAHGDWSVLENLVIRGSPSSGSANGILLRARATISRCEISNFAGDGILIAASYADGTNANNWEIHTTRVHGCMHGLHTVGADANAGIAINFDASDNMGWGILDESFLGNTYVTCHAANNSRGTAPAGAFSANSANGRCFFLNCYVEGDIGALVEVDSPSIIFGGFAASSNTGNGGTLTMADHTPTFRNTIRALNEHGGVAVSSGLGSQGVQEVALEFSSSDTLPFRLHYGKYHAGWWEMLYGNVAGAPIAFSAGTAPEGYSQLWLQLGFYIGWASDRVKVNSASAVPGVGSGTWTRGDRVLNTAPVAGDYSGWICVASGTPGTWKGYGLIEV